MSDEDGPRQPVEVLRNAARGGQERFLVALGDGVERPRIAGALISEGFVLEVGSVPEGLARLADESFDLAILDLPDAELQAAPSARDPLAAWREMRPFTDLVLIGDGDPSLGDAELLRKSGWDVTTLFKNWAEELKKAGVTGFDRLVIDDSIFEENGLHPHWPADQVHKRYVAEVAGLNLNANCVDFYLRVTSPGEIVNSLVTGLDPQPA